MSTDVFTLPELARHLDVQYRTLQSWVERGLLQPSVQRSTGTGTRNVFDAEDAVTVCILVDLRAAGVSFETLERAADRLRTTRSALSRQAMVVLNGDVRVVFSRDEAARALDHGGLTLVYNTVDALDRVARALDDR